MKTLPRVVIGISGASGAALAIRVLELLAATGRCESHVVVTSGAERTLAYEVGDTALDRIGELATKHYDVNDIGAAIASGSFRTAGMIVVPCSVRTLSAIAASAADNLLVRAADVHLKERRRLVLVVRESPLHLGHLRAMATVTEIGAIVAPPVPAFYARPASLDDMIDHMARRSLALLNLDLDIAVDEWKGSKMPPAELCPERAANLPIHATDGDNAVARPASKD
jgi:4-hydroxy-3-polyprenylbenzoate decarboxylase